MSRQNIAPTAPAGRPHEHTSIPAASGRLCALLRRLSVRCRRLPGPYNRTPAVPIDPDGEVPFWVRPPDFRRQPSHRPRRPWGRSAILVLLALGLAAGAGAEEWEPLEGLSFLDTGPLRIRDQLLIGMGFLSVEPESADVLGQGQWQIDLVQSVTNTWVQSSNVEKFLDARDERAPLTLDELRSIEPDRPGEGLYHADGELYRTSLVVRRGIGHGLQLSLTVPALGLRGGAGDSVIEGFHDTFGFGQQGRDGALRNDYRVYVRDARGNELYRPDAPGFGLSDISLGIKARLRTSSAWHLAVAGTVKLPTGDEDDLAGSGSIDLGLQVLSTRYFDRSCLHAAVAVSHLGESQLLGDQTLFSAMLAYERAIGTKTSIVAQTTVSQSPFGDLKIGELDQIAYLVDLGVKRGLSERTVIFAAISENVVNLGSSIDVGLHFGITRTLR